MTTEPWVSVDQLAEHLGVTRDSIYRCIDCKYLALLHKSIFGRHDLNPRRTYATTATGTV